MKITRQNKRDARRFYRLCLVDGLLDEGRVRQVVQQVCQATQRGRLAVLWQFRRLVKIDLARHTATVESAEPLPSDLQASVQAGLSRAYGPGLSTSFA